MIVHFLEASSLAQTPGSIAIACVEYPRSKRGSTWMCAFKVGHHLVSRVELNADPVAKSGSISILWFRYCRLR